MSTISSERLLNAGTDRLLFAEKGVQQRHEGMDTKTATDAVPWRGRIVGLLGATLPM